MVAFPGYFAARTDGTGEFLEPLRAASSGWNPEHIRGPAITGALARAAERMTTDRPELRPARATFELFRPSRMVTSTTTAVSARQGRRLALVDSQLVQDGQVVARAQTLFLARTQNPDGRLWTPGGDYRPPPDDLAPDDQGRLYRSGVGGWSADAADHNDGTRKQLWQTRVPIVAGEDPSPFQFIASAADMANLVAHWGDRGVEYINADVTVALSRLSSRPGIGLAAIHRLADTGVGVGTAVLFDTRGAFGTATVAALANAEYAVSVAEAVRE